MSAKNNGFDFEMTTKIDLNNRFLSKGDYKLVENLQIIPMK